MPRQLGLLRRGMRYFTNFKVPKDLRAAMGKEHIRVALGTSDHREASQRIVFERARWLALFEEKRGELPRASSVPTAKRIVFKVSEQEAFALACRHLISRERKFRDWFEENGADLNSFERETAVENISVEAACLQGGGGGCAPDDGRRVLERFLEANGMACPPDSPAFHTLLPLFRRAELEHVRRQRDEFEGTPAKPREACFRDIFAHSPLPTITSDATLSVLISRYASFQKEANRAPSTIMAFNLPCRLLREYFGDDVPLSNLTGEAMESFCRDLKRYPINAAQRYRKMKVREAIIAADAAGDSRRLNARTIANNFERVSSLFAFAVEKKLMAENPAKDRYLRESFGTRPDVTRKAQFTSEELNRLFHAPLYHSANALPRRGHFWVPLLGLFHGLRLNEACQLHVADVQEKEGIPFLSITETGENGETTEKRLKTKQSKREVPVHPALIRIGFLDFARQRREAGESPRLFSELAQGSKGGFSELFSKWFVRFVKRTLGGNCKATFHTFRHMFRDAARAARLPLEIVERLAGWESGRSIANGMAARYGGGAAFFRVLAEEIAKIEYPGLDLSHLESAFHAGKGHLEKKVAAIRDREG